MIESFGIKLPGLVPRYAPTLRHLPDLVVELEQLGFDDVMDGEHILFAPTMHHPGGSGNMVHGRDVQHSDRGDTIVMFGAIAARTSRIKMLSSVILGAAHSFAVLARQASTLDVLSDGRFMLGVGPGWFAGEFAAQGVPPSERGARLEETVRACKELWSPGLSTFEGRWIRFRDMLSEPLPVTPGGVPVWWGGNALSGPTARRVAELCDGWLSREAASYDEIARSIENIRSECVRIGRDPASLGFRASLTPTQDWSGATSTGELIDRAVRTGRTLASAGVTHFNIPLSYYQLELEPLGDLLQTLRAA